MNCPSRPDETLGHDGWNQSPPPLAADSTTCQDLNGLANSRTRSSPKPDLDPVAHAFFTSSEAADLENSATSTQGAKKRLRSGNSNDNVKLMAATELPKSNTPSSVQEVHGNAPSGPSGKAWKHLLDGTGRKLAKFGKFIGPGFMVSVAYIDPGNYSTDAAAGSAYRFKLLFIILMSNMFAILLQSLCVKLGTVTGLNLAENCRKHLPMWLNILLYIFAEAAIIATDIAEVIGSAIALNLLFKIPLVAGCAITLADVLIILLFYNPAGSMRRLRAFELFIMLLVLGVVICFCIQLSYLKDTTIGEVLKGYLPSSSIVESQGLYLSCGILGATVMPHGLYLGSGIVQSRLREYDEQAGNMPSPALEPEEDEEKYRPSLAAIRYCLSYSTIELALCLFTFALFVNSAILIVAGASLSSEENSDLFGIYELLSTSLAPAAGTIFALALLLSGTSAGIVCTIAGQMVSEGALNWTIAPWMRRLITRLISITPSIIIAAVVGKDGLSAALNASQVALSVILPFVSCPLIYFTCRNRYMTVTNNGEGVKMRNNWLLATFSVIVWLIIVIMNIALLVLVGLGKA
ncbi:MAG: hypothetical protein M1829_005653 [Trizodia sp. TS-e1964]|nr:MAG: hypothetical protein M1829_005653 [Trizodia sp. TS-e1964]